MLSRHANTLGLCAAGLLALAAPCPARQGLTLTEAIQYALKQNRDLQMLGLQLDSRKIAVGLARSQFEFTVRPEGAAQAGSDQSEVRYGAAVARKTEFGTSVELAGDRTRDRFEDGTEFHRTSLRVRLEQPLLRDAGTTATREPLTRAENDIVAMLREIEMRKTDLVVATAELYEELGQAGREVESLQQTIQRLDGVARLARVRERQGRGSRTDTLRSELKLGNAQMRLTAARERLLTRRADFADLLGFPCETEFDLTTAPALDIEIPASDAALSTALSNRMDYAQILQDRRDAERGTRIARQRLLPDLSLLTGYEARGQGPAAADTARLDDHIWFVGFSTAADLPLRGERLALGRAMNDARVADLRIETLRAAVARQVQQALLAYHRAQAEIPVARQSYQLARDRARLSRRLFEMARGDHFSVSEAEDELQAAEDQWLSAEAAGSVEGYRLLRVLGTLVDSPAELKPREAR